MRRSWVLTMAMIGLPAAALAQTPPDAAPAPAPAPAPEPAADPGYDLRLRQVRERVEDLKGRVFDSKTRLMVLREQILQNLIVEARATITHVNDTSAALILEEVLYFLDNEKIYYQSNRDSALESGREFQVYSGSVSPGNHLLNVEMVYRGNGKVFSYLSGYVFRVKSSFPFFATKGREVRVKAVAYEKGGAAARLEDRPSVRFEMQQQKVVEGGAATVPGASPVPAVEGTK